MSKPLAGNIGDVVDELEDPFLAFERDVEFMLVWGREILASGQTEQYIVYGSDIFLRVRQASNETTEGNARYSTLLKAHSDDFIDILTKMSACFPDYISKEFLTLSESLRNL